ncbi:hypothetical protein JVU11DRAFT_3450 [Chiua virens]|nr:hypothetical protein JVU11DRAFT_3450 [Chiua virens]
MTLVDSLDSILMLYSYTGFTVHSWQIFEASNSPSWTSESRSVNVHCELSSSAEERTAERSPVAVIEAAINQSCNGSESKTSDMRHDKDKDATTRECDDRATLAKQSTMSELSILLTILSILLAFTSVDRGCCFTND